MEIKQKETRQKHCKHYKINYNKITICIILLFVLSFSFLFFNLKGNTINAGQVTVFIDPGHGGSDAGCIQNGFREKDIDLSISLKLKGILEGSGYRVIMRRTNDSGMSMQDIVNMANASGANLFVSVHCNSSLNPAIQGIETYWSASNPAGGSSQLATSIHNAVVQATGRPGRVLRSAEFVVIKYTTMPAALVECGFLSNPEEAQMLSTDDYQNRAAQGIANGIHAYVNSAGVSGTAATTAAGEKLTGDVLINVDTPANNQTVGGVINLEGWAIDKSATVTTGISAVHVYDGPANGQANFIGQATLGIARPDVAAAFGKGNLTPSGFKLAINTASLAKGTHVLHIYANNEAVGWRYTTVVINVVNDGSAPAQTQTQAQTQAQTQTQTQTTTQNTQQTSAAAGVNADRSYASSGTKRVLINIDTPKNNTSINGRLKIEGWALETSAQNSTGITAIHVYDGPANGQANFIGQATYGLPRPDVANSLGGRAGFINSGFIADFDVSKLSAGPHNIYVYANNYYLGWQYGVVQINIGGTSSVSQANITATSTSSSSGSAQQFVKVAGISGANPETNQSSQSSGSGKVLINIDSPKANQSVNGAFTLAGWAIETSSTNSTGITAIHIYDGPANGEKNFLTAATYGIARPDVAAYYGKANFANSGFSAQINLSKLSNGSHTLYVYAYNYSQGWKWATVNINVGGSSGGSSSQVAGITQASTDTGNSSGGSAATQSINVSGTKLILINIDSPYANSSVGGGFEISGWAADKNSGSGTGINMVHVYDGPANGPQNMIGVANYGIARPDVAAAFGNGNITSCGFKIKVDSSRLTQGQHTIYIYANNPEIGWKYATLTINITSGGTGQSSGTAVAGGSVSGGTNIVGYVPVSVDQLLRPFIIRGSSQIDRARRLADLYIKWGQAFNIRADIAWAQMCHETGCLEFGGVAQPGWNNFAGIGITGPGAVVTFASEELGVIAHYAHLAWYVYPNDINAYCNINYDPRHIGGHKFNGDSSLNTLNSRWAPAADYVSKIIYFTNQIWG
ncbi:MAG: N-acetylmuramoyl-L-alanine amidase [Actinobacteria bacterium]|nr:N-acetylmuramoyl-L-alanine amidase [Cyanobacteriota bacterium]MCL6088297.1 N-acetylmuramoyl-L-alanine amidase [Actinomycetota bacterium]